MIKEAPGIIIKSKFITPNSGDRKWYASNYVANSINGSKGSKYKSHMDYVGRETEATVQVTKKLNSYLEYTNQNYKVTSEGHFDKEKIWTNKEWKEFKHDPIPKDSLVWSMIISFSKEYAEENKILSKEDSAFVIRKTFDNFCRSNNIDPKSMSFVGQFHLDKPHHPHVHLRVHQKYAAQHNYKTGEDEFRRKGKFKKESFEAWKSNMDYALANKEVKQLEAYSKKRNAIRYKINALANDSKAFRESLNLAIKIKKELKTGRITYKMLKPTTQLKIDKLFKKVVIQDDQNGPKWNSLTEELKTLENKLLTRLKDNSMLSSSSINSVKDMVSKKRDEAYIYAANGLIKSLIKNNNVKEFPKIKKYTPSTKEAAQELRILNKRNNFLRKVPLTTNIIQISKRINQELEAELNSMNELSQNEERERQYEQNQG